MAAMDEDVDMPAEAQESPEHAQKQVGKAMILMQHVFEYSLPAELAPKKDDLKAKILAEVERNAMAPFYEVLCARFAWIVDEELQGKMKSANAEELKKFDTAIAEARESHGDVEVADAVTKKATYLGQIGSKDAALQTFKEVPEKALSTGQKIDVAMTCCRLGFLYDDRALVKEKLALAKELNEQGGDWDRRNRLKVYEGAASILARDFAKAADLLLDSVATFTAYELLTYELFIFYTVLACLKAFSGGAVAGAGSAASAVGSAGGDRPKLKKKVIDSPDVLSVIGDIPHLGELLNSLYECRYGAFMSALAGVYPALARDRLFATHAPYFLREMRIAAYTQFLESYRSVTLGGMSRAFGVSPEFLDSELSRFIAAGRVNAKVDAVSGVVETTRPDTKNAQYHAVIKHGDALLNKVQKLSRVVAV